MVLEGHEGLVNGVAITPDGTRVVSASSDQTLRVWGMETLGRNWNGWSSTGASTHWT